MSMTASHTPRPELREDDSKRYWCVPFKGGFHLQRKQIASNTDSPLSHHEEVILALCESLSAARAEIAELRKALNKCTDGQTALASVRATKEKL